MLAASAFLAVLKAESRAELKAFNLSIWLERLRSCPWMAGSPGVERISFQAGVKWWLR